MTDTDTSSKSLERDAERRRAEISETADELKERLSPETLMQYGQDYIRGPGGQRLLRAAQENPMAAILILAGAGWLLYTASRVDERGPTYISPETVRDRPSGDYPSNRSYAAGTPLTTPGAVSAGATAGGLDATRPLGSGTGTSATSGYGSTGTGSTGTLSSTSGSMGSASAGGSQPGVMGDGTMAQDLNQPGNPGARVTKDEVEDAFKNRDTSSL